MNHLGPAPERSCAAQDRLARQEAKDGGVLVVPLVDAEDIELARIRRQGDLLTVAVGRKPRPAANLLLAGRRVAQLPVWLDLPDPQLHALEPLRLAQDELPRRTNGYVGSGWLVGDDDRLAADRAARMPSTQDSHAPGGP